MGTPKDDFYHRIVECTCPLAVERRAVLPQRWVGQFQKAGRLNLQAQLLSIPGPPERRKKADWCPRHVAQDAEGNMLDEWVVFDLGQKIYTDGQHAHHVVSCRMRKWVKNYEN